MKTNVGGADKWARILFGSFLIGLVMVDSRQLHLIGIVPLATGLVGRCGLYSLIGFSTCPLRSNA